MFSIDLHVTKFQKKPFTHSDGAFLLKYKSDGIVFLHYKEAIVFQFCFKKVEVLHKHTHRPTALLHRYLLGYEAVHS
jgi:hypothetical protein